MSYQQQPPQNQQQAPQFQQQPQAPMGMLHLTVQGSMLTSTMTPPTVHLNGYPVRVKHGRNAIPVFAGPLHIDIHSQYMRVYGRAALDFTVLPNQAVPVFYGAPYHQFASTGSIGHSKVKRKGVGVLLAVTLSPLLVLILVVVLLIALG